jgi:hypothetical protein
MEESSSVLRGGIVWMKMAPTALIDAKGGGGMGGGGLAMGCATRWGWGGPLAGHRDGRQSAPA